MFKAKIIVAVHDRKTKQSDKVFGYLIEYPNGKWKYACGRKDCTLNEAILLALRAGLKRLQQENHEIHIYTGSDFITSVLDTRMAVWAEKGFRNKNGPIAHSDLWNDIYKLTKYQKIVTHSESHPSEGALIEKLKKRKEGGSEGDKKATSTEDTCTR